MEDGWEELSDWSRALKRDPRAFARIFDRHEGRVFRHSLNLGASFHDAEDVTAASFFELWRRRDKVRIVEGSTLPWLLVTATNISLNSRRSLRRYRTVLDRLPRTTDIDENVRLGSSIDKNEDLYRSLKQLNPTDGSLLVLTAVDGVAINDAARLLGISDGAARVRLHRARKRLQNQLDRSGDTRPHAEGVGR